MKIFNILKNKKILIAILIVLTIIKLMIGIELPLRINGNEFYDDTLLHTYAINLRETHNLGIYDQLTLVKGTSYSFFLALCNFLCIPYSVGLHVLYIFACYCVTKALKPKFNKKTLAIIYILLLFSPVMNDMRVAQRVYRNAILPPTILLIYSGFIGIFLRKDKPIKESLYFIILSTFSLIFFWHIKEDSIIIIPFTLTISLLTIIYWIINDRKKMLLKVFVLFLPFTSLFIFNKAYAFVNYKNYGVNVISDKSNGNFSRMIKDILLIDNNKNKNKNIWISSSTFEKLYKVSPTFKKLEPSMKSFVGWKKEDGEIRGDLVIWQIRYVMSMNGLYENANKADKFSKKVALEIEDAFKKRKLKKDKRIHITSQMRGIDSNDIKESINTSFLWLRDFSRYDFLEAQNEKSLGKNEYIENIQSFLSGNVIYPNSNAKYLAVSRANRITDLYKESADPITILSIICFAFLSIKQIIELIKRKHTNLDLYIVILGIGLSAILISTEVALFTSFFDKNLLIAFKSSYCASVFPLIQLFKYLNILFCINILYKYFKGKITKKNDISNKIC